MILNPLGAKRACTKEMPILSVLRPNGWYLWSYSTRKIVGRSNSHRRVGTHLVATGALDDTGIARGVVADTPGPYQGLVSYSYSYTTP